MATHEKQTKKLSEADKRRFLPDVNLTRARESFINRATKTEEDEEAGDDVRQDGVEVLQSQEEVGDDVSEGAVAMPQGQEEVGDDVRQDGIEVLQSQEEVGDDVDVSESAVATPWSQEEIGRVVYAEATQEKEPKNDDDDDELPDIPPWWVKTTEDVDLSPYLKYKRKGKVIPESSDIERSSSPLCSESPLNHLLTCN